MILNISLFEHVIFQLALSFRDTQTTLFVLVSDRMKLNYSTYFTSFYPKQLINFNRLKMVIKNRSYRLIFYPQPLY